MRDHTMTQRWTIVGVDCATQEAQLGLARAVLHESGELELERVTLGTAGESAAASINQWIAESLKLSLKPSLGSDDQPSALAA